MKVIQLLATDLDGTLIGSATEFPLYTSFREKITELRSNFGTIWVACTGRTLSSFKSFFSPMRAMGMAPEFVIVNHAYIFERTRMGYMPHLLWNLRIAYIIWLNQLTAQEALGRWHDTITGVSGGVTTLKRTRSRMRLRFDTDESARVAAEVLNDKLREYKHLQVFRARNEIDVRTVPFTKGLAVSELAKHLGINTGEILTIGNGHNDISMLDLNIAGMTACPANSEPEVLETVNRMGGHISREKSLGGVMDAIKAYQNCSVESSFPDGWVPPSEKSPGKPHRTSRKRKSRMTFGQKLLLGFVTYVVLVVFANYRIIPFVSDYIMIPYRMLLKIVEKFLMMLA